MAKVTENDALMVNHGVTGQPFGGKLVASPRTSAREEIDVQKHSNMVGTATATKELQGTVLRM